MTHAMAIENVNVVDRCVTIGDSLINKGWDRAFDDAPLGVRQRIMLCDHCQLVFPLTAARRAYWADGKVCLVVFDQVDLFREEHPSCRPVFANELDYHLEMRFKPLEKFGPKATAKPEPETLKRHHERGTAFRRSPAAMCH